MVFSAATATSTVGELPYASDPLHVEFSGWARGMHRPLLAIGQTLEDGQWKDAKWLCTAPVVYASKQYLYGLTVEHCVRTTPTRRITEIRAGDLTVTVLPYQSGTNTVRIWRGNNTLGVQGILIHRASAPWFPGVKVFVFGYARLGDSLEPVASTGHVSTWPGWEEIGSGEILHDGPTWFGWSGGGIYVYNTAAKRFEILAVTEEALGALTPLGIALSQFDFVYSVPKTAYEYMERDAASALSTPPPPPTLPSRGRFANWAQVPQDVQERWSALYEANAAYELVPFEAVLVSGEKYGIGPKETVTRAWLEDRLKARGKLQDVDWSEFLYMQG